MSLPCRELCVASGGSRRAKCVCVCVCDCRGDKTRKVRRNSHQIALLLLSQRHRLSYSLSSSHARVCLHAMRTRRNAMRSRNDELEWKDTHTHTHTDDRTRCTYIHCAIRIIVHTHTHIHSLRYVYVYTLPLRESGSCKYVPVPFAQ